MDDSPTSKGRLITVGIAALVLGGVVYLRSGQVHGNPKNQAASPFARHLDAVEQAKAIRSQAESIRAMTQQDLDANDLNNLVRYH